MAEDWTGVAAEIDEALRSISSDGEGYPATIRKANRSEAGNEWEPGTDAPTYHTVWIMDGERTIRDASGTRIEKIERQLMVSAMGVSITDDDLIAVGIAAEAASEATIWQAINEVRPFAPAGTVVYYTLILDGVPGAVAS